MSPPPPPSDRTDQLPPVRPLGPPPQPEPPPNTCVFVLDSSGDYHVLACNCSEGFHSPQAPTGGTGSPATKNVLCEPD